MGVFDAAAIRHVEAGKYRALYKYLQDRFANRVVLTFGEIEDLMGTALPDAARSDAAWWSVATTATSEQSDAWTLAERAATVNMLGQRVLFER